MFLKCSKIKSPNGKEYKNYKIVESVRQDGKVKHKILFTLGNITEEKAEKIKEVLSLNNKDNKLVSLDKIVVDRNIDFLDIYVLRLLWKEWELDVIFKDCAFAEKLVINRCINPKSKIGTANWNNGYILDCLNEDAKVKNKYGVYTDLDCISRAEKNIQEHLYKKLKEKGFDSTNAVIYDITSTYFEDTKCTIALRGYSRDKRPDKEQIVIALAITSKGYPFYWKVYEGNTQDVETIKDFVEELKENFKIKNSVLVFDRGMVSKDNIALIEEQKYEYITAIDKNEINSIRIENSELTVFDEVNENNIKEKLKDYVDYEKCLLYKEYVVDNKRYIMAFDINRKKEERNCREEKIEKFKNEINEINIELSKAKRNRDLKVTENKVNALLRRYKFLKIFYPKYEIIQGKVKTYRVEIEIDKTELRKVGMFDGVTCFSTNTKSNRIASSNIIKHYRDKNKVEESFHEIKSHIHLRPIFVSRENRVRAHVTICILAYLLLNTIEERLQIVKEKYGVSNAVEELGGSKINILTNKENSIRTATMTKITDNQNEILQCLGYQDILNSKEVRAILKKLSTM